MIKTQSSPFTGEIITHGWWLTQGQNCCSEARTEIWVSWLPSLELFLLSASLFYTPRAWGDQGSADSSRTQVAMAYTKPSQALPSLNTTRWQSQQKRRERLGPAVCHTACDEAACPSRRSHWAGNAQGQSGLQPGGSLAGSGLTVCGIKQYQNCWYLLPSTLCPHQTAAGERNPPGELTFLLSVISWFWREHNCGEQRVEIRHVTNWGGYCKTTLEGIFSAILLAVKSGQTRYYSTEAPCSALCMVWGPSLGLITIQISWAIRLSLWRKSSARWASAYLECSAYTMPDLSEMFFLIMGFWRCIQITHPPSCSISLTPTQNQANKEENRWVF